MKVALSWNWLGVGISSWAEDWVVGLLVCCIDNGITAGHEIIMKCVCVRWGVKIKTDCDCSIQFFLPARSTIVTGGRAVTSDEDKRDT